MSILLYLHLPEEGGCRGPVAVVIVKLGNTFINDGSENIQG